MPQKVMGTQRTHGAPCALMQHLPTFTGSKWRQVLGASRAAIRATGCFIKTQHGHCSVCRGVQVVITR